jgi:hypothetical protein
MQWGRISYDEAGTITFQSAGQGLLGRSGIDGVQCGAVIWEVIGGDGSFDGARGLITSSFTINAQGDVLDNHFACFVLPR